MCGKITDDVINVKTHFKFAGIQRAAISIRCFATDALLKDFKRTMEKNL